MTVYNKIKRYVKKNKKPISMQDLSKNVGIGCYHPTKNMYQYGSVSLTKALDSLVSENIIIIDKSKNPFMIIPI